MQNRWLFRFLLLLALFVAYKCISKRFNKKRDRPYTMLVLGSGGHTTELLKAMEYTGDGFARRCYVIADTDRLSAGKIPEKDPHVITIPRAREVHQSYVTSVFTTLWAILHAFAIAAKEVPDLLVVNGPGTCLPLVLACRVYRLFGMRTLIVSLEALTRAKTLSLTTRLCYPFVDTHIVLWEKQAKTYSHLHKLKYVNVFNE